MEKSILINGHKHVIFESQAPSTDEELKERSQRLKMQMNARRSIRTFSDQSIPREVIEDIIMTASSAPSGAHKQPWTFCVIGDPLLKTKIRQAAEEEERLNYSERMSETWKKDLEPFGTDADKPFLEIAPWLIVVFKRVYELDDQGVKHNNYYVNESVGIASGMLIAAIHQLGLVTLTHTPSPMNFLAELLQRPKNERAFLLLPVGYPQDPTYVPDIERKALREVSKFY